MALDRANIFNFEGDELKKYLDDPFCDCFESTKSFAEALFKDIETKETPHSLLLSANYGMGKTFFATRFTQYLRNKGYKAIYFSAWESDYLQDPFLAFLKAVISNFKSEKCEKFLKDFSKIAISFIKPATTLCKSDWAIFLKPLFDLIFNFLNKNTEIADFKRKFKKLIACIENKKLIVIVDELDRCRPDYAMKTLECIKHFFEVEGLIVIMPTNEEALKNAVKSLYNIEVVSKRDQASKGITIEQKESYLQKFYDDVRILPSPIEQDYLLVACSCVNENILNKAIQNKIIVTEVGQYNSMQTLILSIAHYSQKAKLTLREMKKIIPEIVRMCNEFYEPARCEALACYMVYRNIELPGNILFKLNNEHPFRFKKYPNEGEKKLGKNNIFMVNDIKKRLSDFSVEHSRQITTIFWKTKEWVESLIKFFEKGLLEINDYKELNEVLQKFVNCIFDYKMALDNQPNEMISNWLDTFLGYAEAQKEEIRKYQEKYGSDDDDEIRMKQYMEIVFNPEKLYTIGEKLLEE